MKKDLFRKAIVLAIIILFVGVVVVPSVMSRSSVNTQKKLAVMSVQNTWIVDDEGDGDFTFIQGAIDDPNVNEGDIIEVYSGTYNENVAVNKKLTIKGIDKEYPPNGDDTGKPVIDGGGSGDVVYINANEVNISNFMIQNNGIVWVDAGIDIQSDYNTISDNIISNNAVGIFIDESNSNNINNNIISNNRRGIHFWGGDLGSCFNVISRNTIKSNNVDGIYMNWFPGQMCMYNHIYYNNFINNTGGNAHDDCSYGFESDNIWDDGKGKGNYWDDYRQKYPEANGLWSKGIWDTPYNVPNLTGFGNPDATYDRYPLIWPYINSKSGSVDIQQNNQVNPQNNQQNILISSKRSFIGSQQSSNPLFFQIVQRLINIR